MGTDMRCRCGGRTIKKGYDKKKRQKYKCKICGKIFAVTNVFDENGMLILKGKNDPISKSLYTTFNLL